MLHPDAGNEVIRRRIFRPLTVAITGDRSLPRHASAPAAKQNMSIHSAVRRMLPLSRRHEDTKALITSRQFVLQLLFGTLSVYLRGIIPLLDTHRVCSFYRVPRVGYPSAALFRSLYICS